MAAAGSYFLSHRVIKQRVVRQLVALVRGRRAARATSAVGLDAVPGLFKRLSKSYRSIGDSGVGGLLGGSSGGGSPGSSYALTRGRRDTQQQQQQHKKRRRISDLHQVT